MRKGTVALCVAVGPHESLGKVNLYSMGMSGSSEENIHMQIRRQNES